MTFPEFSKIYLASYPDNPQFKKKKNLQAPEKAVFGIYLFSFSYKPSSQTSLLTVLSQV